MSESDAFRPHQKLQKFSDNKVFQSCATFKSSAGVRFVLPEIAKLKVNQARQVNDRLSREAEDQEEFYLQRKRWGSIKSSLCTPNRHPMTPCDTNWLTIGKEKLQRYLHHDSPQISSASFPCSQHWKSKSSLRGFIKLALNRSLKIYCSHLSDVMPWLQQSSRALLLRSNAIAPGQRKILHHRNMLHASLNKLLTLLIA